MRHVRKRCILLVETRLYDRKRGVSVRIRFAFVARLEWIRVDVEGDKRRARVRDHNVEHEAARRQFASPSIRENFVDKQKNRSLTERRLCSGKAGICIDSRSQHVCLLTKSMAANESGT